jgi:hypothetical protein
MFVIDYFTHNLAHLYPDFQEKDICLSEDFIALYKLYFSDTSNQKTYRLELNN